MTATSHQARAPRPPDQPGGARRDDRQHSKLFYVLLALPGMIWLVVLFIVPFYAVLAIAMGQLDRLFESPIAVWNPLAGVRPTSSTSGMTWSAARRSPGRSCGGRSGTSRWRRCSPADRLPDGLLRGPVRRTPQGPVPHPADRAVLDQLHDAHAGLDRPAADQRLREQGADFDRPHLHPGQLARRILLHRDPRPGLRLHPVPDPGALRRAGPDRPGAHRGRPRPGAEPGAHVPARDAAAVPADHPDRHADHRAADDRRLLHQPADVRRGQHVHDRQPDPGPARHARPGGAGRGAVPRAAARAAGADDLLRGGHQPDSGREAS